MIMLRNICAFIRSPYRVAVVPLSLRGLGNSRNLALVVLHQLKAGVLGAGSVVEWPEAQLASDHTSSEGLGCGILGELQPDVLTAFEGSGATTDDAVQRDAVVDGEGVLYGHAVVYCFRG